MNHLTPLKSIRQYCLSCCNNQPLDVRLCSKTDCWLFPFRQGKKTIPGSLIKNIRRFCLDCGEGTAQAVRQCEFSDCPLFAYRLGKSPAHQQLWHNRCPEGGYAKKSGSTHAKNDKEKDV